MASPPAGPRKRKNQPHTLIHTRFCPHVGTPQGKFVSRRTPQKRVGKLIWRVMRPCDQIEKNYIKFSEVRYSVLSICAARKCPDGMQTWGDVKTESHVFACPHYI